MVLPGLISLDINNHLIFLFVVPYQCTYEAVTNTGLKRQVNEDNYSVIQLYKGAKDGKQKLATLVVVADGMGGSIGGQLASTKAVEIVSALFEGLQVLPDQKMIKNLLEDWILAAHNQLVNVALEDSSIAGMGTTITVLLILGDKAHISWVGDSRMYIYDHKGKKVDKITGLAKLKLVTRDHSFVWEQINSGMVSLDAAETLDNSHIITHSLGSIKNQPIIEYNLVKIKNNDKIMVCSDGVNLHLKTNEIHSHLSKIRELGLELVSKEMEQQILDRGANDNFTFVLLDYIIQTSQLSQTKVNPIKSFVKSSRNEIVFGAILSLLLIWVFNRFIFPNDSNSTGILHNESQDSIQIGGLQESELNVEILDSLNHEANKQLSTLLAYYSESDSYINLTADYIRYLEFADSISEIENSKTMPDQKLIHDQKIELRQLENRLNDELLKLKTNEDI